MESSQPGGLEQRDYEKPEIHTIELVAEEVLGAGCKNNTAFGAGNVGCSLATCVADGT